MYQLTDSPLRSLSDKTVYKVIKIINGVWYSDGDERVKPNTSCKNQLVYECDRLAAKAASYRQYLSGKRYIIVKSTIPANTKYLIMVGNGDTIQYRADVIKLPKRSLWQTIVDWFHS